MIEADTHIHTHNEMTDCVGLDYLNCKDCHCHFQDEAHTACCKGAGAREMYEARQVRIEKYTCGGGCYGCQKR